MTDPAALTDEELAELQEWSDRATPEPWNVETESDGGEYGAWSMYARGVSGGDPKEWVWVVRFDDDYGTDQFADAHFIAAARKYLPRLIAALRASRAVADDLAIALHHCSAFLPLFLSEHGEEGRKLRRALAVHEQVDIAMGAYCDLTGTHRPDLTNRTVTKDVHD